MLCCVALSSADAQQDMGFQSSALGRTGITPCLCLHAPLTTSPMPPSARLVLEDEGARVTLCGDACPVGECVTGVVAAVRGRVQPNGDFEVTGCVYAGVPPQPPLPRCEDK